MPPGPLVAVRLDRGGRGALLALCLFALLQACRRAPPPAPAPPRAAATVNGSPIPVSRVQVELDRMRLGFGGERRGQGGAAGRPQAGQGGARHADRSRPRAAAGEGRRAVGERGGSAARDRRARRRHAQERSGVGRAPRSRRAQPRAAVGRDARAPPGGEVRSRAEPAPNGASATETRAWYDRHKAEFEDPEAVHCLQIVVRTPEEAKSVLDQLRAGAPFDKVARQAGTSPDARNGGDLGWFPKGTMPKVFDDTCFSLGTNKISGVVASPYGYHVFKVLGRRAPRTRKFDEVKAETERRATAEKPRPGRAAAAPADPHRRGDQDRRHRPRAGALRGSSDQPPSTPRAPRLIWFVYRQPPFLACFACLAVDLKPRFVMVRPRWDASCCSASFPWLPLRRSRTASRRW